MLSGCTANIVCKWFLQNFFFCLPVVVIFVTRLFPQTVKGSVQVTSGSSVTVAPNTTVSISCQASGWYPAPTITWNINNTVASTIYYITDYTTGTDGLVSAVSTFTIAPMADTNLTCLAKVQTLDAPLSTTVTIAVREQGRSIHLFFLNSSGELWVV